MEIQHTYTLSSMWFDELFENYGGDLINKNLLLLPKDLGDGGIFFTEVIPGLSALVLDFVFYEPMIIKRLKSDNDLFVIHYDLSDGINSIQTEGINHRIGYKANLGLGVFDNAIEKIFQPAAGKRVFSVRLLVSRELLLSSMRKMDLKSPQKRRIRSDNNTVFFYDNIDSISKIIMHSVKKKSLSEPAFELYVQGISLRLLAKFMERYSNLAAMLYHVSDQDADSINKTKKYLLSNLCRKFPGISYLSNMALMPRSKYKFLFRKLFDQNPQFFFERERIILAKDLLQSRSFCSVLEVSLKLGFSDLTEFSNSYFEFYKSHPKEDLIRKDF